MYAVGVVSGVLIEDEYIYTKYIGNFLRYNALLRHDNYQRIDRCLCFLWFNIGQYSLINSVL